MGLEADRREWAHSGYSVPVKRELRRNGTGAVACSRLYLSALLPLSVLVPGTESYPFPSTTIHYCAVSSFLFFSFVSDLTYHEESSEILPWRQETMDLILSYLILSGYQYFLNFCALFGRNKSLEQRRGVRWERGFWEKKILPSLSYG